MAIGLAEAIKVNGGEAQLLSTLMNYAKDGSIDRAARGGFTPEVHAWFTSQSAGKTMEQVVQSANKESQAISASYVPPDNTKANAEYQQRLKTLPAADTFVPALGTPEYTNYLIAKGKTLGMDLSKYTQPTSATLNSQDEIKKINAEANANQQNEYTTLTNEYDSKVDLSSSAKLTEKLIGMLDDNDQPKTPSLVEEFNKQRQSLGVGALEDELAGMDAEMARLDADFASTIEDEEGRKVSLGQVRKRQGAVELAYNRKKRDLQVQRQYVADRLDTKLGIVSTIVNLTGQDYQLATQKYDSDFNKAVTVTNLIRGIEEDQKADEEKRVDNARANVQVMYNLIKEGNVSYDKLSQSEKSNITKMEAQAGLPTGFVKYISETIEDPAVSFLSAYTDANGKRIQPIATLDPKTGAVKINNVSLGQAKAEDGDSPADKIITQATLNKLAAAGVPEVVSIDIQRSLNSGKDEAVIRAHLKSQLGAVTAQKYMDAFNSVMKASGLVEIP